VKRALIVTIAALALVINAGGAAQASETSRSTFQGANAYAVFDSTSGCTDTSVFVEGVDGRSHTGPGQPEVQSFVYMSVVQYDTCTQAYLLIGSGYAVLVPDAFQMTQRTATLATTIEMYDYVSGNTFSVNVNVAWTGAGDTSMGTSNYTYRDQVFTTVYHSVGTSQTASAAGTVISNGTNFTPGASNYGYMSVSKSGYLQVTRG
jgi:hypothetical protein